MPVNNPCDFVEGDWVYLVSLKHTEAIYGKGAIHASRLGEEFYVNRVFWSRWGGDAKVKLRAGDGGLVRVSPRDLDFDNTYVPKGMGDPPKYMEEIHGMSLPVSAPYKCHWLMYTPQPNEKWSSYRPDRLYKYLTKVLAVPKDPCHYCYDECKDCDKRKQYLKDIEKKNDQNIVGVLNTNRACWAAVMREWGSCYKRFDSHPTRLLTFFDKEYLDYPYESDTEMSYVDIIKYVKYMKRGACLPRYLEVPTKKDYGKDLYFTFRLNKVNKNRLFWYLCTIRNIAEKPGIVKLTNHFVERGKMESLMAYVMAHVCLPGFSGGHSAIFNVGDMRSGGGYGQKPIPDMPKVIEFVVKCHRFLTRKLGPYVTEPTQDQFYLWKLSVETRNCRVNFKKPRNASIEDASSFNVKSRTIKEK